MALIHTPAQAHTMHGVTGIMHERKLNDVTGLFMSQKFTAKRPFKAEGYRPGSIITVSVRFDDQCKNGHQSFSVTGDVQEPRMRDISMGGCIHDEIAAAFPELAHLIKWHLVDTDGPMHYVGNVTYHAGNRDYNGREAGQVSSFDTVIKFGEFPITYPLKSRAFKEYLIARLAFDRTTLKTNPARVTLAPVAVAHKDDGGYKYEPNYTLSGFDCEWHECPFSTLNKAQEFCEAMQHYRMEFIQVPTAYSEGKARELDAARRIAVWPEATDEELSTSKEELTAALNARLPGLIAAFRADVETCGFMWEQTPATDGSKS